MARLNDQTTIFTGLMTAHMPWMPFSTGPEECVRPTDLCLDGLQQPYRSLGPCASTVADARLYAPAAPSFLTFSSHRRRWAAEDATAPMIVRRTGPIPTNLRMLRSRLRTLWAK